MKQDPNGQPHVSILICNYNYGRFIAKAIESALGQTYPNVETIIADDGSSDNSREVIERYSTSTRTIFKQNGGQCSAFNAAFAASSGEIICLLDSDDYFSPDKVARVVEGYSQNPSAQWLFHPLERVHDGDAKDGFSEPLGDLGPSRILDFRRRVNKFTAPATSGLTFRRQTFARISPLPEEVRLAPDNYMKFVILGLYPGFFLTEALGTLRLHGNNAYSAGVSDDRRAQSVIEIAHSIRSHFPELCPQADRLISITRANRWRGLGTGLDVQRELRRYLNNSTTKSSIRILAGAAGRFFKHSLESHFSSP